MKYECDRVGLDRVFIGMKGWPSTWKWRGTPDHALRITEHGVDAVGIDGFSKAIRKVADHACVAIQTQETQ